MVAKSWQSGVTRLHSLHSNPALHAPAVSLSVICNMGPPSEGCEDEVNNALKQLIQCLTRKRGRGMGSEQG